MESSSGLGDVLSRVAGSTGAEVIGAWRGERKLWPRRTLYLHASNTSMCNVPSGAPCPSVWHVRACSQRHGLQRETLTGKGAPSPVPIEARSTIQSMKLNKLQC